MQKGEQWGRRRNQAVALAMLSLNFSGKASRGFVREISWDAGLWGRRRVPSRQVDLWVTSLETVIEVSCGFRYCVMWSKNLSLSPASICDSLQQMSPPILSLFSNLYISPFPHGTSPVLPVLLLWTPISSQPDSLPLSLHPPVQLHLPLLRAQYTMQTLNLISHGWLFLSETAVQKGLSDNKA